MRLVLINNITKALSVYQGRECLAVFEVEGEMTEVSKDLVLELLTAEYKELA